MRNGRWMKPLVAPTRRMIWISSRRAKTAMRTAVAMMPSFGSLTLAMGSASGRAYTGELVELAAAARRHFARDWDILAAD